MALKKSKTLKNGTTGEYWRITNVSLDRNSNIAKYEISLYLNKTASDNKCSPLDLKKNYSFILTSEQANGDLNKIGYTKIKEKAASQVPDPFTRTRPAPIITFDEDLSGAEDI